MSMDFNQDFTLQDNAGAAGTDAPQYEIADTWSTSCRLKKTLLQPARGTWKAKIYEYKMEVQRNAH